MACPGNHERDDGFFPHYLNKFTMPTESPSAMYYSYNVPWAHIISYNSECFYPDPITREFRIYQYEWLI